MERILLASRSARRMALLRSCGIDYEVAPADISEEPKAGELPAETAERLAYEKAAAIRSRPGGAQRWILAADTLVVDGTVSLGKPRDASQARQFLQGLRGRTHQVITGVCLYSPGQPEPAAEAVSTDVVMRSYSDEEADAYIATGDPYDKAGGYAIQNLLFHPADRIQGCLTNVVGLPVC
jgi:septum formation protein